MFISVPFLNEMMKSPKVIRSPSFSEPRHTGSSIKYESKRLFQSMCMDLLWCLWINKAGQLFINPHTYTGQHRRILRPGTIYIKYKIYTPPPNIFSKKLKVITPLILALVSQLTPPPLNLWPCVYTHLIKHYIQPHKAFSPD